MALFGKTTFRPARFSAERLLATQAFEVPSEPVHHVPLTPRQLRVQAVHRLQVGLFGLAGMLLLVSLANVIMDRAEMSDADTIGIAASASAEPANDPLVDMGVAPELPVSGKPQSKPAKTVPHP
jgi:hypothetical protein